MRLRSSVLASVVSIVAVVSVAGCANASPSVAAYVGSTAITQKELDTAIGGVEQTLEEGQQVSPQAVLDAMVQGAVADQIAAANGIVVTDAERDQVVQGSNLATLLPIPAAKVIAYDVADQQVVATKLGEERYLQLLAQAKVTVNPRYGVIEGQQQLIAQGRSGSLAKPASPSPTPGS